MMLKQTKIVASISDLRCDVDFIRDLFEAGMNVVRMNTAHASREGFEKLISNVREVSNRIAILMDTKGPEIRTTSLVNKEPMSNPWFSFRKFSLCRGSQGCDRSTALLPTLPFQNPLSSF